MVSTRSRARAEGESAADNQPKPETSTKKTATKSSTSKTKAKAKPAKPAPTSPKASKKRKEPEAPTSPHANEGKKRKATTASPAKEDQKPQSTGKKSLHKREEAPPKSASASASASTSTSPQKASPASANPTITKLLTTHATFPLSGAGLADPRAATPATVLAHLINALLSSTRISHGIAARTLERAVAAGYAEAGTLRASTWEARAAVLTEGGYARYREKTATALGELAEVVEGRYGGDARRLLEAGEGGGGAGAAETRRVVAGRLKEIKGLGNVGVDIFFDTVQAVWPAVAPFVDKRSLGTAEELGLGRDVERLFELVGRDAVEMGKLSAALTRVRLEKRVAEFK